MQSYPLSRLMAVVLATVACFTDSTTAPRDLRMEATTPTSLTGEVGTAVTPVPTVRVSDAEGRPVGEIHVSFSITGPGHAFNQTVRTDGDGLASVGVWTLGTSPGSHTVTARAAGIPDVAFHATARAGMVAQLLPITGEAQVGNTGELLTERLRVRVTDRFSNPIANAPVSFAIVRGGGTLEFEESLSHVDGIASTAWTLGSGGGEHEVVASSHGLATSFFARGCDPACQAQQILFVRDGSLYNVNVGGVLTQFTGMINVAQPAWSPDGSRLAFVRIESDQPHIYVMNADGTGVRLIASNFHSPSWSADNRTIAVAGSGCFYECGVFLIDTDSPGKVPHGLVGMAASPAWSPDGKKIAYVGLSGDAGYDQLRIVNADGTGDTPLALRDEASIVGISWSPDGKSIAFGKCFGTDCDIHIAEPDGHIRQLTHTGTAHSAAWSPDGSKIAFVNVAETYDPFFVNYSVAYVDPASGGNAVILSTGLQPAWVPQPAMPKAVRRR